MLTPSRNRPIHVVLLDQRVLVRSAFRCLLEHQPHLIVIGEEAPRPQAEALVARSQPDIILLRLVPQQADALELIPTLLAAAAQARLLVVVDPEAAAIAYRAVQLGARGVVQTDHPLTTFLTAIAKVYAGELWVSRRLLAGVLADRAAARRTPATDAEAAKIATLTKQERTVIALLSTGLQNRQIAQQLAIAEVTVRHHLSTSFRKLGVRNRTALLAYAYRYGLVEPPSGKP